MKKFALCVGINAYGGANTLQGCVNDALDWKGALEARGFNVATLLDSKATRDQIVSSLRAAMEVARYGDRFVFTYSGHGTQLPDENNDESDHLDEAICPVDCFQSGMIVDDEIANIFGSRRFGVRAVQVSDSCHSATVSRVLADPMLERSTTRPRMIPASMFSYTARAATPHPARSVRSILLPHLLMAGCKDDEYSYDASYSNRPNGAFTFVALNALKRNPKTYDEWQKFIKETLPNEEYPQTPVLNGSAARRRWTPLG